MEKRSLPTWHSEKKKATMGESVLEPIEEYEEWRARHEAKRKIRGQPCCISNKWEYILRKKRQGQLTKVGDGEVEQEEERAWEERMAKGEIHRDILREYLRGLSRASRREEIALVLLHLFYTFQYSSKNRLHSFSQLLYNALYLENKWDNVLKRTLRQSLSAMSVGKTIDSDILCEQCGS